MGGVGNNDVFMVGCGSGCGGTDFLHCPAVASLQLVTLVLTFEGLGGGIGHVLEGLGHGVGGVVHCFA